MRSFAIATCVALALFFTLSCSARSPESLSPDAPDAQAAFNGGAVLQDSRGMSDGVLGVYWLELDPAHPTIATLAMARTGAAQGDLYALSLRPLLTPSHLRLINIARGPGAALDCTFRFTHPYKLPTDVAPPATASKRMDLFLFDVQLVLGISGTDRFFDNTIQTNWDAMPNPSGFRQIGPLLDLASIGVVNGTNVFPYQLVADPDPLAPAGNYDATAGWSGNEWFAPTGYDVVPQGARRDTTMRLAADVVTHLPIVVLAKYMDPRAGATGPQKRANRLPSDADPTRCRYFLPEACGDLQRIDIATIGELVHASSAEIVPLTVTVLDWDNASAVASSFPNQNALTEIAVASQPTEAEASFPDLRAAGVFQGTVDGASTGTIGEWCAIHFAINNFDQSLPAPGPEGVDVRGLLRIRDAQDLSDPAIILLDEALQPQPVPVGFEISTRFQKASVHVALVPQPPAPPVITGVSPASGFALRSLTLGLTTTGTAPTSWSWNFGGGANPNISNAAAPTVALGLAGSYSATVTATNAFGTSAPFPFTLTVSNMLIPLRVTAITSGGTLPGVLYGLGSWNQANLWNWVETYLNPVYVPAGIQFDQATFEFRTYEYPAIFNVDTGTEHSWVMAVIYDQPPDKLDLYVVNSAPWYPNLGGIAGDQTCNPDNIGRGCYIVPKNTLAQDPKIVAHELGHVMNLPHIRIDLPVLPINTNLMSYHTPDLSLWPNISSDTPFLFCWLWATNPMNQQQVVNDWCWDYM